MRLTNIAQMVLPHGQVHSYAPEARGFTGREFLVSFDQSRHVGEGDRPGSWMALAARLPVGTTLDAIADAWQCVVARHGTLRTAFTRNDQGELTLHELTLGPGSWLTHDVPEGSATRDVVRAVFDTWCRPFAQPSHRVCVIQPDAGDADPRPAIVIGSDHSHVDMWSLLVLLRDLADALAGAELAPAAAFAEHTAVLAAQAEAPQDVRERWSEVMDAGGGLMPVFPLPLGDVSRAHHEVVEVRDVLDRAGLERLSARADAAGVRLISLAVGVLTEVSLAMTGTGLRAVFPVHSRHDAKWHDSAGWYITNAVLSCDDPSGATAAVKDAIRLGSYPLAPILAPYGGMPATPGMFAVSWLDTRRLPVQVSPDFEVQYVSAVVPTDGVMIWFIVNEQGVHLRCRYPDTPVARESVGTWIDSVQSALRDTATVPGDTDTEAGARHPTPVPERVPPR
ncbi:peptide synthetase [Microbacterium sp. C7(2022)]|uniref:peptide synthetase n=1 Tax=Microbacterium sp. C7(2022) TaxID=2992759 RepID=UPI00237B60C7|nr:peptide synthetase [Microbacterium sp. C7(2022)]MDE0546528.1 peptide synthetase [Microbacterium sp. C7(2022)]